MSEMEKRIRVQLHKSGKHPLSEGELQKRMRVGKKEQGEFLKALAALEKSGAVIGRNRHFSLVRPQEHTKPATIVKLKNTFGFARVEGATEDIFIPGKWLMGTMPGDKVMVRVKKSSGALDEGEVVAVVERVPVRLSGTVIENEYHELLLQPDNNAFAPMPLKAKRKEYAVGEKLVASIEQTGDHHRDCFAIPEERFGSAMLAKNCCAAILDAANISAEFPSVVLAEAEERAAESILPETLTRIDLRDEVIFTIDGADTKDIDDAVSLEKTETGWRLGVHIADVSHYVREKSAVDQEAFFRGTSVYFAQSVIPMLPPALSNGACSLNPNADRLAFSAFLTLDPDGRLIDYRFAKTVLRSRIKGVYHEVNQLLAGTASPELEEKYAEVLPTLRLLEELSTLLTRRRKQRGALDLASVETKILVDDEGKASDVVLRQQGVSENIIEQMMLLANEAAATLAIAHQLSFVFRVHEPPSPEKLENLRELLGVLQINAKEIVPGVSPLQLSALLEKQQTSPLFPLLNAALLRTMQKARYEDKNLGHYGLALENYTHFTSPIRRYSDLAIHRILSGLANGAGDGYLAKRYEKFAAAAAKQASARELAAMSAERACEDCYHAEWMHQHLGEEFPAIISSVASHGVYAQLENGVEGLIRREALDPSLLFDGRMQYLSADGKLRLRIGDRVIVRVAAAEISTGRIDFLLK